MVQYVYDFSEGDRGMGANLAEVIRLGLPVPPGFTITTKACRVYLASGTALVELAAELDAHLHAMERAARSTSRCCSRFAPRRGSRCLG